MQLTELLSISIEKQASDLHLATGAPPIVRIDGELQCLDYPILDFDSTAQFLAQVMTKELLAEFNNTKEIDFAFSIAELARFRVNVFWKDSGMAAVFRIIPERIMSLEELKAPKILQDIALLPQGLVLITGTTGSGKSTTLAAIVDFINQTQKRHILSIEDPIEFIHQSNLSLINQREVQRDTLSFAAALRAALRADPDIILLGEMRDLASIKLALTAAETGHLVLATLHTHSAPKAVNRIIDIFPGDEKIMIRSQLVESLQAVISQKLVKKINGGRIAAYEVMLATPAIRNLIREDKIAQMYSTMQTSKAFGMHTLEQYLCQLFNEGLIRQEEMQAVIQNHSI